MRGMLSWASLGLLLSAGPGIAQAADSKLAVLAAGDCHDPRLLQDRREIQAALAQRPGQEVVTEQDLQARLGPVPAQFSDVDSQLRIATSAFYDGAYRRAEHVLDSALETARRLPVGSRRWALTATALAYRSLTLREENRPEEARAAFRDILRVDPTFKLDPDQFAPVTRAAFNRVRDEMAREPYFPLEISSTPDGATVFLDGLAVGKTPLRTDRVRGDYGLKLVKDGQSSLVHRISVNGRTTVRVALAAESSLAPGASVCLPSTPEQQDVVDRQALALGVAVGASRVVITSRRLRGPGGAWMVASVLDVPAAQKMREGAIHASPDGSPPTGFDDLLDFVVTGQARPGVESLNRPLPAMAMREVLAAPPELIPQPAHPSLFAHVRLPSSPAGWSLVGAGTAGVITGVVFGVLADRRWSQFNSYFTGAGPGPSASIGLSNLSARASTDTAVSVAALSAGVISLAVGSYLLWAPPPSH